MNEFTKAELDDLLIWSNHLAGCNPLLIKKIQFMIDSYCEHKETEMDCDGGISLVCKKCGETTMDIM